MESPFRDIKRRMEDRRIPEDSIQDFLKMVKEIRDGVEAHVPLDFVSSPDKSLLLNTADSPEEIAELSYVGEKYIDKVVIVKLNGGRSTTMGGEVPKGVLVAKNGRSYVDIIVGQLRALREKYGIQIPLLLMNSFFTHEPTKQALSAIDVPVRMFVQGQVPRVAWESLEPLHTGTEKDWAPPGHGDVYESLRRSGLLDDLIKKGFRWAFISNLDNLAACFEPWILGLMARDALEFIMEVTERTPEDRKGGTLVVRDGRLSLLEIAQVAPEERDRFMDIGLFNVFNTNNVWVDLAALRTTMDLGTLKFPVIQNIKFVGEVKAVQLETAMGAAIESFTKARGLRVPRDRFFPTKTVEDLFVLQSDACVLDSTDRLSLNPARPVGLPFRPHVIFSPDFMDSPLQLKIRFEDASSVSLLLAESLEVGGSVYFEKNVKVVGRVKIFGTIEHPVRIKKDTVLRDAVYTGSPAD